MSSSLMRIVPLGAVLAVAAVPLSCGELGQSCTLATCSSFVSVDLPEGYASTDEEKDAFCERVAGSIRIDDEIWEFSAGELTSFEDPFERGWVECGAHNETGFHDAPITIGLGRRLNTAIGLELVDTDGTHLVYEFGVPDYERSAPNGKNCGPICDVATVRLSLAE